MMDNKIHNKLKILSGQKEKLYKILFKQQEIAQGKKKIKPLNKNAFHLIAMIAKRCLEDIQIGT
jgi:hypothetical protein